MAPRRRCPTCGSKQWHKEPSSGLIACSEGHILQNYRNETTEIEEMGPHAMHKRRIKSKRRKRTVSSKADPKLYHGERGRYLYFQCLQLIFRKQVATLTQMWDLPPEFEIICRDLWALHLSLLPTPPPTEPYIYAQENEVHDDGDHSPKNLPTPTPEVDPQDIKATESSGEEGDEKSGSEDDSELDELMKENSEISSSSDEEREGEDQPRTPAMRKKGKLKGHYAYESPASTISVLVLACWTLRIPVLYRDFTRLIESYELLYLDPTRMLPSSMVIHLTKHNIQALSPPYAPTTLSVHKLASRLAKRLDSKYGVYTPEANAAPILWRVTKAMGGTPTLYGLTKRLSCILSVPLTLHWSLAPKLRRVKKKDPERHKYDNVPSEVGLMAVCIVVLKMVYGLDGKQRLPKTSDDPGCSLPRIDEYLEVLRRLNKADEKAEESIFNSQYPMAVGDLTKEEIDEYLTFSERALLGDNIEHEKTLDNYFSLKKGEGRERQGNVRDDVWSGGQFRATMAESDDEEGDKVGLQPGEEYKVWSSRDVLGTLPEEYEKVIRRGVKWVGVPEEYLCEVIEMYERRLIRWWKLLRRRSRDHARMRGGLDDEEGDDFRLD